MWQPLASVKDCNPKATVGGTLYNSMIAPYTVGPMALKGATWYQGESSKLRPLSLLCPRQTLTDSSSQMLGALVSMPAPSPP